MVAPSDHVLTFTAHFQRAHEVVEQVLKGDAGSVPGMSGTGSVHGALILTNLRLVFVSQDGNTPHLHTIAIESIYSVSEEEFSGVPQVVFEGSDFRLTLSKLQDRQTFIDALQSRLQPTIPSRELAPVDLTTADIELEALEDIEPEPELEPAVPWLSSPWSRDGRIVAALLVGMPPLGTYLIWSNPEWAEPWKKWGSAVWSIAFLVLLGVAVGNESPNAGTFTPTSGPTKASGPDVPEGDLNAASEGVEETGPQEEDTEAQSDPLLEGPPPVPIYDDVRTAIDKQTEFHFEDGALEDGEPGSPVYVNLPLAGWEAPKQVDQMTTKAMVQLALTVLIYTDSQRTHVYVTPVRQAPDGHGAIEQDTLRDKRRQLVIQRPIALKIVRSMLGVRQFTDLVRMEGDTPVPTAEMRRALGADSMPGARLMFEAFAKEQPLRDRRAELFDALQVSCGAMPIYDEQAKMVCGVDVLARDMAKDPKSMTIENCSRPILTEQCWSFTCDITGRDPNGVFTTVTRELHAAHPSRCVLAAR